MDSRVARLEAAYAAAATAYNAQLDAYADLVAAYTAFASEHNRLLEAKQAAYKELAIAASPGWPLLIAGRRAHVVEVVSDTELVLEVVAFGLIDRWTIVHRPDRGDAAFTDWALKASYGKVPLDDATVAALFADPARFAWTPSGGHAR